MTLAEAWPNPAPKRGVGSYLPLSIVSKGCSPWIEIEDLSLELPSPSVPQQGRQS